MNALSQVQQFATTGVSEVWTLILNFLGFLIIAGLLFFFGARVGRGAFLALLLSFYVGFAIYAVFPYANLLKAAGDTPLMSLVLHAILYIVFTVIAYVVLRNIAGSGYLALGNIGVLILSVLGSGFLLALSYHSFSVEQVYSFTPAIESYFGTAKYFFWWFAAPLVGMLLFVR